MEITSKFSKDDKAKAATEAEAFCRYEVEEERWREMGGFDGMPRFFN